MTFEEWMEQIDQLMSSKFGMSVYELSDPCFRDMFDDEMLPEDALQEALEQDDSYQMFMMD